MATQIDFSLNGKAINVPLLNQEMATALGAQFNGMATRADSITVNFTTDASAADQTTVTNVIAAHNAATQTAQQVQDATADTAAATLHAQAIAEAQFWEGLTAASITTIPQAVALIVRLGKVNAAIIRVLLRRGLV